MTVYKGYTPMFPANFLKKMKSLLPFVLLDDLRRCLLIEMQDTALTLRERG